MEAKTEAPTNGALPQQPQTAIERQRSPMNFDLANVDEAYRFASMLAKSGLMPAGLAGKVEDILVTILMGRDFGLSPMQSIRLICVVKGKPYMYAALKLALVKKSKECIKFKCVETSATKATFETDRVGEGLTTMSFTMEEAQRAGLTNKGNDSNWDKYPAAMLRWRCISQLADFVYPDVIGQVGDRSELNEREIDGGFLERVGEVSAPPPPLHVQAGVQPASPATPSNASPAPGASPAAVPLPSPASAGGAPGQEVVQAPAPMDALELEVVTLKAALEKAKSRRDARAYAARVKALPDRERAELTALYERLVRELPEK